MRDISIHGSEKDENDMRCLIEKEKDTERACIYMSLCDPPNQRNLWVRGVDKNPRGGGGTPPTPPPRFFFRQPQGRRAPMESTEKISEHPQPPPQRRAGEGGSSENFDGEEVSSEISEQNFRHEELVLEMGGNGAAAPSTNPAELATSTSSLNPIDEDGEEDPIDTHPQLTMAEMEICDWGKEYERCPFWGESWRKIHGSADDWPPGFQFLENRLIFEGKICIPLSLQNAHIRAQHEFMLHPGPERLWKCLVRQFMFASWAKAREYCENVMQQCASCQACQRPRNLKGPIVHVPVPPGVMQSVAMDVFKLPPIDWEGESYDAMVTSVDRHSGWIVAIPCKFQGLTGKKVAVEMLKHAWRPFGIPGLITSDRGSHFVNAWWQTLCATLGIRHAFSQAYHHSANGRAEMAGQQIMEKLRKLNAEEQINWVEALPNVLDRYHDVPGESGYSPYQILFGRDRPIGNLPFKPPRECEDAIAFFQRMEYIDARVAEIINKKHSSVADRINANRKPPTIFNVGDVVWYKRSEGSGTKLDTRWEGPCKVVKKIGEHSYEIRVAPDRVIPVHVTFLKIFKEDKFSGTGVPLYFHRRTVPDPQAQPDEYETDRVLDHKVDADGKFWFKVLWKGLPNEEVTWEPINHFFHRYSSDVVKYCKSQNLSPDVISYLQSEPTEN